nr:sodium- and chloride-dependent glycine transporter 2-like [Dermacentor andersoni]
MAAANIPTTAPEPDKEGEGDEEEIVQEKAKSRPPPESPARATWGSQLELFLACLGLSVGLGSFWRLPSLISANGGVAFLVMYLLLSITVAKPIFCMELFLGQFSSQGSVGIWRCVPIGKGIGVSMGFVSALVSCYSVLPTAYAMLFAWHSLSLPWAACSDRWGADAGCFVRQPGSVPCRDTNRWFAEHYARANLSRGRTVSYEGLVFRVPERVFDNISDNCQHGTSTAAEQFYFRHILSLSDGVTAAGNFRTDVLVCMAVCWVLLYLLAAKGIRLSGKMMYTTSLLPCAAAVMLMVNAMRLPGASVGILYMLWPDWEMLLDTKAKDVQVTYKYDEPFGGLDMCGDLLRACGCASKGGRVLGNPHENRGALQPEAVSVAFVSADVALVVAPGAVRLFCSNKDVDAFNTDVALQGVGHVREARAVDVYLGYRSDEKCVRAQAKVAGMTRVEMGNLPHTIPHVGFKPYMVMFNIDVKDGLVNGAVGALGDVEYARDAVCI